MQKLINYPKDTLYRGMIIRCKGVYPYEEVVDFMLCETCDTDRGLTLLVVSGYKAGLRFVSLPKESTNGHRGSLNTDWLRSYWEKWGYGDCALKDVYICETAMPDYPSEC
jgi:hypothetical protein